MSRFGSTRDVSRKLGFIVSIKITINALMGVTVAQVGLGITALLYHVPAELGSAHQANALILFTVILSLMHSARKPKKLVFVKDLWAHKPA